MLFGIAQRGGLDVPRLQLCECLGLMLHQRFQLRQFIAQCLKLERQGFEECEIPRAMAAHRCLNRHTAPAVRTVEGDVAHLALKWMMVLPSRPSLSRTETRIGCVPAGTLA